MPIRTALVACVLVLGTSLTVTSASAGDPYGGFGPSSDTAPQEIGSDPGNSSPTTSVDDTLPWHQQQTQGQPQTQDQQDSYGDATDQQGSADSSYDTNAEDGH